MLLLSLEVLDKLPAPVIPWVLGIGLGALGYFLGLRRPLIGLVAFAFLMILIALFWNVIGDPPLAEALTVEAPDYTINTYLPLVLGAIASIVGVLLGRRRGARAA